MPVADLDQELKDLAFNFFYSFSRLEFALKEAGFHSATGALKAAKPDWSRFTKKHAAQFAPTATSKELLRLAPEMQVLKNGQLGWQALQFDPADSELHKTVINLKTIRNNLFHGGKARDAKDRTKPLLECGIRIIEELVELGQLEADFRGRY